MTTSSGLSIEEHTRRRAENTAAAVEARTFPQLPEPCVTELLEGTPECPFPVGMTIALGVLTREEYLGRLGQGMLGDLAGFSLRRTPTEVDLAFVLGTELDLAEGERSRPLAEIYAAAARKGLFPFPLEVLPALQVGCFVVFRRPARTFWVATVVPFIDHHSDGLLIGMLLYGSGGVARIVTAGVNFGYPDHLVDTGELFAFLRPRLG